MQPGPSVFLKCIATGNPSPEITWELDSKKLANTERLVLLHYTMSLIPGRVWFLKVGQTVNDLLKRLVQEVSRVFCFHQLPVTPHELESGEFQTLCNLQPERRSERGVRNPLFRCLDLYSTEVDK